MNIQPIPKILHVFLGRFSPLQLGHQITIDTLISNYGLENILVIVGSSNSYNERTPYSYEDRKQMILAVYPDIRILPLPDTKPELIHFDGTANNIWLDNIRQIEASLRVQFIFCGGSEEDLSILSRRFKTVILVDRSTVGRGISATLVREAIEKGDDQALKLLLDTRVLPLAKAALAKFKNSH